jgi:hypothetical protein
VRELGWFWRTERARGGPSCAKNVGRLPERAIGGALLPRDRRVSIRCSVDSRLFAFRSTDAEGDPNSKDSNRVEVQRPID